MSKHKYKGERFTKGVGVGTPTLIRKKGESDDEFVARMKSLGYNLEKVGYHWMPSSDSTRVSNMVHPGKMEDCKRCNKPKGNNTVAPIVNGVSNVNTDANAGKKPVAKVETSVKPEVKVDAPAIVKPSEIKVGDKITEVKSDVSKEVKPADVLPKSKDEEKKRKKEKK